MQSSFHVAVLDLKVSTSYPERLSKLNMLPITFWHECLDLVYLYKAIASDTDTNIKIKIPARQTRSSNANSGLLIEVPKAKTVTFQNSF